MKCRNCGTEIADKAIVCYRCGVGTTEPVRKPVPVPARGGGPPLIAGILPLILSLAALAGSEAAVLAVIGVLVLIARFTRRR